jgi:hypothetical protein
MSTWSFRFILFFLLILFTQPHFRFTFLIPFRLGDITFGGGVVLHVFDCISKGKKLIRLSPVTKLCLLLMTLAALSNFFNINAHSTAWNPLTDSIFKVCLVVMILDAQTDTVYRASAITAVLAVGTLWWIKGGVRLASAGASWGSGDRLMGANVSIIQNPNDFAYLTAFFLPVYFLFFQISKQRYIKMACLACFLAGSYIVLETGSRTGFLCMLTVFGFYFPVFRSQHRPFLIAAIAGLVFMLGLVSVGGAGLVSESNIKRIAGIGNLIIEIFDPEKAKSEEEMTLVEKDDADSGRIRYKKAAATFALILKHPLMGVGPHPRLDVLEDNYLLYGMVHTEALVAGRLMGIPGIILYLTTLYLPFRWGRDVRRMTANTWPQLYNFAYALQAQALVILVGGAFSPSVFNFPHMTMFVVSGAIHRIARQHAAEWQPVQELPANLRPAYA